MEADTILQQLWERINDRDSLPSANEFGAGYRLLRARLDVRDVDRAQFILRSLVNGFGAEIELSRADPDDPGTVAVWTTSPNPTTPQSQLLVRRH